MMTCRVTQREHDYTEPDAAGRVMVPFVAFKSLFFTMKPVGRKFTARFILRKTTFRSNYQTVVVQAKAVGSAILRRVVEKFWHDVAQQTRQWTPTTRTPLFKPHFGAESQSISDLLRSPPRGALPKVTSPGNLPRGTLPRGALPRGTAPS